MLYKNIAIVMVVLFSFLSAQSTFAKFAQRLCNSPEYECIKVKPGESWATLFPDPDQRMMVKKVNRMNTPLSPGMMIAVPRELGSLSIMDLAPFPRQISPRGTNLVRVDLGSLAWGAYDTNGELVNWGPVSGGKSYCPDVNRACRTVTGTFTVYNRQGSGCVSSVYPVGKGGAPMPYCMHFKGGYALHGSPTVPGHNASHGCVRLFVEDAKWLNHEFVDIGSTKVQVSY